MKGYIVLEIGFSYDDNFYTSNEDGGGSPVKIFFSKKSADEKAMEMEFIKHSQINVKEFTGYDYDDDNDGSEYTDAPIKSDEFESFMKEMNSKYGFVDKYHKWDNDTIYKPNTKYTTEERKKYLSFFKEMIFYSVEETEFDVEDMRNHKIDQVI